MIPAKTEVKDGLKDIHLSLSEIDGRVDCIREGLGIRASGVVWDIRMGGLEVNDAWQKYFLHSLLQKVEDMAVAHLDREAGFRHHVLHPFSNQLLVRRIGKDDAITQFSKERLPEGKQLMVKEDSRYSNLSSMG
jgi:hypothetical protein